MSNGAKWWAEDKVPAWQEWADEVERALNIFWPTAKEGSGNTQEKRTWPHSMPITVYLDDSGTDVANQTLVVAGLGSCAEQWDRFKRRVGINAHRFWGRVTACDCSFGPAVSD
jgi:hypothetical protein